MHGDYVHCELINKVEVYLLMLDFTTEPQGLVYCTHHQSHPCKASHVCSH